MVCKQKLGPNNGDVIPRISGDLKVLGPSLTECQNTLHPRLAPAHPPRWFFGIRLAASAAAVGATLIAIQACHAKPNKAEKPSLPVISGDAHALEPNATAPIPKDVAVNGPVWQFVEAWGAAIERHDIKALEGLYADRVSFYGQRRSKTEVISAKQAAFAKEPGFHLRIPGFIEISRGVGDYYVAKFHKLSGKLDNLRGTDAKLVVGHNDGGPLLVLEEADSDASEARNSGCSQVTAEVVNALPEVKRSLAAANDRAEASNGQLRVGGLGPQDLDDPGGFSVSLGLNSDERFDTFVSYEVTREGVLSVNVVTYGAPVVIPTSALRKVANACRR